MGPGHGSFPGGTFLQLPIGEEIVHAKIPSAQARTDSHAYSLRQTMSQRTAGYLDTRSSLAGRHFEAAFVGAIGRELLTENDTQLGEHGKQGNGIMPGGEQEPIPVRPVQQLGIETHFVAVQSRQDIRCPKALTHIPLPFALRHEEDISPDIFRSDVQAMNQLRGQTFSPLTFCRTYFAHSRNLQSSGDAQPVASYVIVLRARQPEYGCRHLLS